MANPSVADFTHALQGANFPAGKNDLMDLAEQNGAGEHILRAIQDLPDDDFQSMADVMRGYGEENVGGGRERPDADANPAAARGGSTSGGGNQSGGGRR